MHTELLLYSKVLSALTCLPGSVFSLTQKKRKQYSELRWSLVCVLQERIVTFQWPSVNIIPFMSSISSPRVLCRDLRQLRISTTLQQCAQVVSPLSGHPPKLNKTETHTHTAVTVPLDSACCSHAFFYCHLVVTYCYHKQRTRDKQTCNQRINFCHIQFIKKFTYFTFAMAFKVIIREAFLFLSVLWSPAEAPLWAHPLWIRSSRYRGNKLKMQGDLSYCFIAE